MTFTTPKRRPGPAPLTECKRGHAFTEDNVIYTTNGSRRCRECNRIVSAQWRANNPEKQRENNRKSYQRSKLRGVE